MRKRTYILLLGFILFIVTGCKTRTVYVPVKQTSVEVVTLRDTVIKTGMEYYRDTIITPDTISFLSNPYGFSWAEAKEGKLHHSLSSWPDSVIPVRIQYLEKIRIDSIPVPYSIEVPVYKTKEISLWQKIRIKLGEFALLGLILCVGYYFFRKK